MYAKSYSTLIKKMELGIYNLNLMNTLFLISMEKESKYTAIFSVDAIFCISIYRFIKCTAKSQFENDIRQFP